MSFRTRTVLTITAIAIATSFCSPAHADITTSDGNFTNWSFGSYVLAGSTASVTLESSGGNPGARLNITTNTGAGAFGYGIKTDFSTSQSIVGAPYTLTLDILSGPGAFGEGQGILLVVEQNGSVYGSNVSPLYTGTATAWSPETFTGTLDASLFTNLSGGGSANPDFTSGVPTEFGFAGGNDRSGTLTMYYDNFSLDISGNFTPTPEPSSLVLLGSAVFGVLGTARRLRR